MAFAVTLITGGRLGDRFGHRPVFVAGAASLLAGCAPGTGVLLAPASRRVCSPG
ncbi:MFS transporter [Amycolatopsis thermalba]|uniref:MFS transporter n=1 Tax=Amycolatopsis thermalba TaxID=944492 RepID=UPI0013BEA9F6|nr:MFS transporter [Amycolatopsis thermalba]